MKKTIVYIGKGKGILFEKGEYTVVYGKDVYKNVDIVLNASETSTFKKDYGTVERAGATISNNLTYDVRQEGDKVRESHINEVIKAPNEEILYLEGAVGKTTKIYSFSQITAEALSGYPVETIIISISRLGPVSVFTAISGGVVVACFTQPSERPVSQAIKTKIQPILSKIKASDFIVSGNKEFIDLYNGDEKLQRDFPKEQVFLQSELIDTGKFSEFEFTDLFGLWSVIINNIEDHKFNRNEYLYVSVESLRIAIESRENKDSVVKLIIASMVAACLGAFWMYSESTLGDYQESLEETASAVQVATNKNKAMMIKLAPNKAFSLISKAASKQMTPFVIMDAVPSDYDIIDFKYNLSPATRKKKAWVYDFEMMVVPRISTARIYDFEDAFKNKTKGILRNSSVSIRVSETSYNILIKGSVFLEGGKK